MFDLEGYKIVETHCHNYPVSGCSRMKAGDLSRLYASYGIHDIILTNHVDDLHRKYKSKEYADFYLSGFDAEKKAALDYGVNVMLGCELSLEYFYKNDNGEYRRHSGHFLVYGIDRDFFYDFFPLKDFTVYSIKRICEEFDWVLVQAHGYRGEGSTPCELGQLDGLEIYNFGDYKQDDAVRLYEKAKSRNLIMTAGSDTHEENAVARCFMYVPKSVKTISDFKDCLKAGNYKLGCREGILDPSNPPLYI